MVNRNVLFLSLASFFTDTATAMVVSVLPVYLVHHLNVGYDKLGIIVALATFVSYLFRVLFGFLSDLFGRSKPFLVAGYGLSALVKPLFAFATDWKSVALLRALDRLGKSIRSAPRDRLLSLTSKNGQGKTFGFHKTFDVAGETLGALLALLFLTYFQSREEAYRYLFLATAIPGFLALLSLLPVKDIKTGNLQKETFVKENLKKDLYLLTPLVVLASVSLFMWPLPFLLAKSGEYNISEGAVPLLYLTANLVQVFSGYPTGKLIDTFQPKWVFLATTGFGLLALTLFLKGFVLFAFILFGLHQVLFFNFFRSFIGKYATNKGSVYGVFYTLYGVISAAGTTFLGFLLENFGSSATYRYSLHGLILTTLLGYISFKRFDRTRKGD